jgi:methionine-gamma-lyase
MSHDESSGMYTKAIHAGQEPDPVTGAVSTPIYQSSTFAFTDTAQGAGRFAGTEEGYIYTRLGNPTTRALEDCITAMEGGYRGLATASGMAAVCSAYFALLGQGAHVVSSQSVYGPSRTVLETHFSRFGVDATFVASQNAEEIEKAMRPETKLVYIETPTNPTIEVTDLALAAEIAHAHGALLCVDNTFCSPVLQRPFEFGADISLHSMTKFINGHADVVAGMLVARTEEVFNLLRPSVVTFGGTIDPHQAWLVLRGVKTLPMRVLRGQENAQVVARFLADHPKVEWVRYPGLESDPAFELAKKQMDGPGSLISFGLAGGFEAGRTVLDNVELMVLAVSLGGVETLIQHPASMTHAGMSPEARETAGITDGLVRLSVGCEDLEDILKDLGQALDRA